MWLRPCIIPPERSQKSILQPAIFPILRFLLRHGRPGSRQPKGPRQHLISSSSASERQGFTFIGVPEATPPPKYVAKEFMPNADISYFTQFMDGVAAFKKAVRSQRWSMTAPGLTLSLLSNPDLVKLDGRTGKTSRLPPWWVWWCKAKWPA